MKVSALVNLVIALVCIIPTKGIAQSDEQLNEAGQLIEMVLRRNMHPGDQSALDSIRELQAHTGVSDSQISTVLEDLLRRALAHEDVMSETFLAQNVADVLPDFRNDRSKSLILDIIRNKQGNLKRYAIRSYLRLVNYAIDGTVKSILTGAAEYDWRDRREVYENLIKAYEGCNEEHKIAITSLLDNAVIREDDTSNIKIADRFLVKVGNDYVHSKGRIAMLRKLAETSKDEYFKGEAARVLEQGHAEKKR